MQNITQRVSAAPQGAKQVTRGLAQIVAQNAKQAGETAKAQLGAPPASEKNYDIDDNFYEDEGSGIFDTLKEHKAEVDVDAVHQKEKALLADLESQLKALREKRDRDLAAYNEKVVQEMQSKQAQTQMSEAAEPQGKVRKAMGKVKKAVSSIVNRKQGETKQGSGKG